jgi:Cu2+-exporting ATPase
MAHEGNSGHPAHSGHDDHGGHGGHSGHDGHAGHDPDVFRRLFWRSLVLTIPIVLFSEMVQDWLNYSLPEFPGDNLIAPVLGTIVFLYGGQVFLRGGWDEIRARSLE